MKTLLTQSYEFLSVKEDHYNGLHLHIVRTITS